jgi:hypothetical protein
MGIAQVRETLVRTVLCRSNVGDGHTLSVAELLDGRFAIMIDRQLTEDGVWDESQLKPCIDRFLAKRLELRLK